MKRFSKTPVAMRFAVLLLLAGCLALHGANALAQKPAEAAGTGSRAVSALLVSDIHFDPFMDPAKVARLNSAPASGWEAILAEPESVDGPAHFGTLLEACHTRGMDTSYPLLASSLKAMREDGASVKFITVSGDLIAHSFACKYRTLFPQASPDEYRAFVEKTIAFVIDSLRGDFPGVPVYAALGNNDSDCGDYRLDAHSEFLASTGKIVAGDLPAAERKTAEEDFAAGGYFSASLPLPHTRLLVLDDVFLARSYATCAGKPDAQAAADQIAWLKQQLDRARRKKEKVWVMAHIPPGVDPYSTATKSGNICAGKAPQMFLSSEAMAETLAAYGDVIRLAIFAHTHMDEMRLLMDRESAGLHAPVAVKMISSISPINGNHPAFTLASVSAASAVMTDYRVFAASNGTGVGTTWSEEYDYAKEFRQPDFSAENLSLLVDQFKGDAAAQSPVSQSYLSHYYVGGGARELAPFWPQYVCAVDHDEPDAYRACVCAGGP
jgi:sphingomyelin phosphodiesterase acid-like 3